MTRRYDTPRYGAWAHPTKPHDPHRRRDYLTAVALAGAVIAVLSLALFNVPERYEPRPGQDVCKTAAC